MRSGVKGFTLFEVLIAITIGSVLILVSTIALRMGLSHLGRGEEWLNAAISETTAFDFFWQQVSSIYPQKLAIPTYLPENESEKKDEEGAKDAKFFFKGETDSMSFISPLSLKRHYGYGLILATYEQRKGYEGLDLVYKEKRLNPSLLSDLSEVSSGIDDEANEIVFFQGCEEITFEYLKVRSGVSPAGEGSLQPADIAGGIQEWVGTIENSLPKAIKIMITRDGKARELIAPIMVMYSL